MLSNRMFLSGLVLLSCFALGLANIEGTDQPQGTCLCVTTNGVNVRNPACGTVVGSTNLGNCYVASGNNEWCTLETGLHHFFQVEDFNGSPAWIAGSLLNTATPTDCNTTPPPTGEEFRSVWISTVHNLDWPTSRTATPAQQQADLRGIFDHMVQLNMNVMIFQIRPVGDALYQSNIEPWSFFLTNSQGTAPNPIWDPLAFAITEAHARGIELHAWLNPYRANLRPNTDGLAPNHMAFRYPDFAYPYGRQLWMDPGVTVVQDHLHTVVMDVLNRYDVDGIHFDDYFYPYPVSGVDFPDALTYAGYIADGGTLSLADWRRDNNNRMVQRLHTSIKAAKPHVKFSISPFGIYRPCQTGGMPCSIRGFDQYSGLYADPKLWLENGWMDYLAPQLYWEIDPPAQSYPVLLDWWLQVNTQNRHVYAGNAVYKLINNDWPANEIVNQVGVSRQWADRLSLGNVLFRYGQLRSNTKSISDLLRQGVYNQPALIPEMSWLPNSLIPNDPINIQYNSSTLTWDLPKGPDVRFYAIYTENRGQMLLRKVLGAETRHERLQITAGKIGVQAIGKGGRRGKVILIKVD
ncbi:unnamed protein product [Owenia fusiformis]|uniref:Glycosyl hydrolase-like 10 domain-containing protein n=1 Tax=Owenia fusiformis TaxID=6347 RepID=A0A8S4P6A3_OWEFU|nr:unnamed protein product [Owenia fusiformis]